MINKRIKLPPTLRIRVEKSGYNLAWKISFAWHVAIPIVFDVVVDQLIQWSEGGDVGVRGFVNEG